jgi:uncharacterized membrane protein
MMSGRTLPAPRAGVEAGLIGGILGAALLLPGTLKYKLDFLGFGVCHQLSSHSFIIGGHQLCLCARCCGIYLGAGVSLLMMLLLRPFAAGLPSRRMLPVLIFMFGTMILDGINSTLQALPGATPIYQTTNPLRLITGALSGVALMFVLYPIFNQSFWRLGRLKRERVLEQPFELLGYLAPVAIVVAVILSAAGDPSVGEWLYWPLALGSMAGLLALLMMTNVLIVSTIARRAGTVLTWRGAVLPLLIALILALLELAALSNLRIGLTSVIATAANTPPDLPLVPGLK